MQLVEQKPLWGRFGYSDLKSGFGKFARTSPQRGFLAGTVLRQIGHLGQNRMPSLRHNLGI
jgi:hypothetical protein